MIPLVQHRFIHPIITDLIRHALIVFDRSEVGRGHHQRVGHRRGISNGGIAHIHRQDRTVAAFGKVHGMLGLMGQVRRAIFHLGDLRVGIVGVVPVIVAGLVFPLLIQLGQLFPRWGLDAALFGQACEELLVTFTAVPPHDRSHRRVGLQCCGVHPGGLALDQAVVGQNLQDVNEHLGVGFDVDQTPRPRDRRMVRGGLVHRDAQEQFE